MKKLISLIYLVSIIGCGDPQDDSSIKSFSYEGPTYDDKWTKEHYDKCMEVYNEGEKNE